jgi:pyruvate,water dikinase
MILDWAQARASGPSRAGGKGWQLGILAELGAPVPEGFVIDVTASAAHRRGEPLPESLVAILAGELARRGWLDRPLAVRSSAAAEDSQRASFAGIHSSSLNVCGLDACVQAVREVWDSFWSPAALAYRQRLGIPAVETAMAVVVMPLVTAVAAGVAFTCDPVSGREDQVLIHSNWGLGEALVGGQIEPDEHRLQEDYTHDRLVLVGKRRGSKLRRSEVAACGGTELREMPTELASRWVLSDEQALELGAIARDAAFALDYASPCHDIEWVWDGNKLWIVQARAITARARYTYPALARQPALWSRGNSRDVAPDPLAAMEWSLTRSLLNRMITRTPAAGGYATLPGVQRLSLRHGRLYFETAILQWESFDGFAVPPRSYNQLLGGHQPDIAVPRITIRQSLARARRSVRFLFGCIKPRLQAKQVFQRAYALAATRLAAPIPADAVELARVLHEQLVWIRTADDLLILQLAGSALFVLLELLEKHLPGEGQALTAALLAGGEPSVTALQAYGLMELARVATGDTTALDWLRSAGRVGVDWRHLPEASPFRHAFGNFIERFGHRGVYESYLRNPRWREAPDYLLDTVVGLLGSDPGPLRERQRNATLRARQRVRGSLPLRYRHIIPLLVKFATVERNLRESARSALVAHFEVVRRYAMALGARLQEAGGLENPTDVFHLTLPELHAAAVGSLSTQSVANRVRWRRRQLERYTLEVAPEVIVEHGEQGVRNIEAVSSRVGELWRGTAVGSGEATGVAHIARHPTDALRMAPGAILVAPSTDPGWTPVFLKAGGLVMETGGYVSHGAIVAREFGIPAVVNLPGILHEVRDGDLLEVDGNRGTVRRRRGGT